MLHRAYSLLEVKSIDDEQRIITGIATTPTPDRYGDIVEPKGAEFQLPIPLLWQHKSSEPVGEVFEAKVTADGIEIKAKFAKIDEPGKLKDRLDEAWQSVKAKLVRGLSIGFTSLEYSLMETGGYRFMKWAWLELSAVTIPANAEASIATIRSCASAALGKEVPEPTVKHTPGVTGSKGVVILRQDTKPMAKPVAEQIQDLTNTRAAKSARMNEIQTKATDAGRTKDDAEREEFDTLKGEITGIDAELKDLADLELVNTKSVIEVKGKSEKEGDAARAGQHSVSVQRVKQQPGILFARYAMCIGAAKGIPIEAMRLAKQFYKDDPGVMALVEKAAVAGGSTSGSHYLDDMVPYAVMQDFIEFLRPGSILGKFGGPNPGGGQYPSLNRVGFNERVSGMSTGYSAGWKGEGLPALPSAAVTFNTSLTYHNLSALAVLTKEAIRFSNPSAEARVRDDIARAVNGKMDLDFVNPAKAASGTTSPASITYGVVATAPTGTTAAHLRTNLASMIAGFATANLEPSDIVLIMSSTMALQLSLMTNTLGNPDFPDITMAGGTLRGFPVITSEHLTNVGSPSTQTIIAVKASEVYLADDGVVTVESSDQASIEMVDSSSQSGISGTGASLVSLWQSGLVGLLAQREVTWKMRRATAVAYISPAAYAA